MPKSDTLTSLFFETRQFLAAFGRKTGSISSSKTIARHEKKSCFLLVYQISVDEVGHLQISHPFADIQAHPQQCVLRQRAFPFFQVLCQAAVVHVLKHEAHGNTLRAHAIQLY